MALLLALASPEVELLGVTTVHGNQTLEKTTANALRVLELAGRATSRSPPAPTGRSSARPRWPARCTGRAGSTGPSCPTPTTRPVAAHAVDFLAERLLAAPEPVTLMPTGPLTNVALLLALHPEVGRRIERIVLMGGAIAEGNVTPAAEFNIWVDPEAAARVFASGLDDHDGRARRHAPGAAHARACRGAARSGRIGAFVADLHAFYARFHARRSTAGTARRCTTRWRSRT